MLKYELPDFLKKEERISQEIYQKWIDRKAANHYRRDKKYFNNFPCDIKPRDYKEAIHQAVKNSDGKCFYTDEKLKWEDIGKFGSKKENGIPNYNKKNFAKLPTLEHLDRSKFNLCFVITSWQINDAKNDLNLDAFFNLCELILNRKEKIQKKLNNLPLKDLCVKSKI